VIYKSHYKPLNGYCSVTSLENLMKKKAMSLPMGALRFYEFLDNKEIEALDLWL